MAKGTRQRRRLGQKPRSRIDRGTPEAQARRKELVGNGDPALGAYPLGILFCRGIITAPQHDAGCHYAYLCGRVLGRTKPVSLAERPAPAEISDRALADISLRWREAVAVLFSVGRRSKDAVDNVAVYERIPGWLWRDRPRDGDAREAAALVDGLSALVAWRNGKVPAPVPQAAE